MRPIRILVLLCSVVPIATAFAASLSTTTTLTLTPATSVKAGTAVALSATVADAKNAAVTTGTVTFYDGKSLLGSAQIVSNGTSSTHGTASLKKVLGPGSHSLTAAFNVTQTDTGSVSTAQTFTVTASLATATTIASSPGSSAGQVYLSGNVAATGPTALTGSINFVDQTNADYTVGTGKLGAGTSSYGLIAPTSVTADSPAPNDYSIADFNNDGIPDIALLDGGTQTAGTTVLIFLGDGKGGETKVSAPALSVVDSYVIATGDFNNDGNIDIATLGDSGSLYVFLGDGTGSFTVAKGSPFAFPSAISTTNIVVADFNGDGNLDIFELGDTSTRLTPVPSNLFFGDGGGGFTLSSSSPIAVSSQELNGVGLRGVAVADFNQDGYPDIVVAEANSLTVLLNDAAGGFSLPGKSIVGVYADTIVTGDFNGDGFPDVAANVNGTTIYLNDQHGGLVAKANYPGFSYNLATGDFNSDGILDLAVTNSVLTPSNGYNSVGGQNILIGDGTGNFTLGRGAFFNVGASVIDVPYTLGVGDFNGDGLLDLSIINLDGGVGHNLANGVYLLLGEATQSSTATTSALTIPGSAAHAIVATYAGDTTYSGSTSTATTTTATPVVTTLSLGAQPATVVVGQSVTIAATLAPVSVGGYSPTGNVTFFNGAASLGTGTVTAGIATFSTSSLPAGTDSITASYAGDSNFAASTASAITIAVSSAPPDFSIAATPTSATITRGQSATFTFTVTPINGFSAPVSLACGTLPSEAACTFSPASITPGSGSHSSTLTITTTAPTVSQNMPPHEFPNFNRRSHGIPGAYLAAIVLIYVPRRRHWRHGWKLLVVLAFVSTGMLTGCGAVKDLINSNTNPGTPTGTATITVTASAGSSSSMLSHAAGITVTIQ